MKRLLAVLLLCTACFAQKHPIAVGGSLPAAGGDGACLTTSGGAWVRGSCGTGSPGGSNTQFQFNNSSAFGGAANATYNSTTGVSSFNQKADTNDTFYSKRFTDTTPTGNFLHFQNAAANADLFKVGVDGSITATGPMTLTGTSGFDGFPEIAAPASPSAGTINVWADSTDHRLHDGNSSSAIGTTVVADTGASNNFLTAISAAGVISKARPSCSNLSDGATGCSANISLYAPLASPTFTGTVTLPVTGSTQCLHVNTSGVLSGTGSDCGAGGGGSGTVNSGTQYQLGYYATSTTAISGSSNLWTNAAGGLGILTTNSAGVDAQLKIGTQTAGGFVNSTPILSVGYTVNDTNFPSKQFPMAFEDDSNVTVTNGGANNVNYYSFFSTATIGGAGIARAAAFVNEQNITATAALLTYYDFDGAPTVTHALPDGGNRVVFNAGDAQGVGSFYNDIGFHMDAGFAHARNLALFLYNECTTCNSYIKAPVAINGGSFTPSNPFEVGNGSSTTFSVSSAGVVTASGLIDASAKGVKLPTSCTGLATGTLYNNSGAAAFCP